jgi:hypothetical protein
MWKYILLLTPPLLQQDSTYEVNSCSDSQLHETHGLVPQPQGPTTGPCPLLAKSIPDSH